MTQPDKIERLTTFSGGPADRPGDVEPSWHPKFPWILYAHTTASGGELSMVPVNGGKAFPVLRDENRRLAAPACSPAGDYIVYEWTRPSTVMMLDLPR